MELFTSIIGLMQIYSLRDGNRYHVLLHIDTFCMPSLLSYTRRILPLPYSGSSNMAPVIHCFNVYVQLDSKSSEYSDSSSSLVSLNLVTRYTMIYMVIGQL